MSYVQLFKTQHSHIYELLAGLFVATLIVSNIASVKLVNIGPFVFDAGTILFPLAYIVGDIVTEVYGYRKMRALVYVGITGLLVASVSFWLVGLLPPDASWSNQAAYDSILGIVWRIVAASIVALLVGEMINAYVMARMKIATKGKGLWTRMVSSSAAGSAVDTVIFSVIAFAGTVEWTVMVNLITTVFVIKMLTEIAVSPITMKVIIYIKSRTNTDTYEEPAMYLVN
ncbi:VUT family protein [Candidatus Saccharibacteria bacterium]|nr:VUT family protein [Candidatus Saccharibacteria bacterium]